jgi:hypothetical protein
MSSEKEEERPTIRDRCFSMRSPVIRRSASSGSSSMLPRCRPSRHKPKETPHSFKPEQKFSVPSIGSSSAMCFPVRSTLGSKLSSPMKSTPGMRAVMNSRTIFSTKISAAVTGLSSAFQETSRRRWRMSGRLPVTRFAKSPNRSRTSARSFMSAIDVRCACATIRPQQYRRCVAPASQFSLLATKGHAAGGPLIRPQASVRSAGARGRARP